MRFSELCEGEAKLMDDVEYAQGRLAVDWFPGFFFENSVVFWSFTGKSIDWEFLPTRDGLAGSVFEEPVASEDGTDLTLLPPLT